jgi:excisionase family DNA binding protein
MTIPEIARITKRSRSALYSDVTEHRLHAVRLGNSIRVPRIEFERYLLADADPELKRYLNGDDHENCAS